MDRRINKENLVQYSVFGFRERVRGLAMVIDRFEDLMKL